VGEHGRYTAEAAGSSPAPPTIVRGLRRVPEIRSISAVTLATRDMARGVRFYACSTRSVSPTSTGVSRPRIGST
jgi:hypothetical protein